MEESTSQPRETLRTCWLSLHDERLQSFEDTQFSRELRQRHARALDAWVASGKVERGVADEIGIAFGQAMAHLQRQMATCYIALPPEQFPRHDLMRQAAALVKMAEQSEIDPGTVAQAQAALERDLTWLSQFDAGQPPGSPFTTDATPQVIEAAHILVGLLLGK